MENVQGSSHDNEVIFNTPSGVDYSFKELDHTVTKGEPWNGIEVTTANGKLILNVKAGRKKSNEVAQYFQEKTKGAFVVDSDSNASMPKSLNFAFTGILKAVSGGREKQFEVVIGQGHNSGGRNDWWFGLTEISVTAKGVNQFDLNINI